MSIQQAHTLIRQRWDIQWTGAVPPYQWPNQDFDPPNDGPWLRFIIRDAMTKWTTMGGGSKRLHGEVVVQVFSPQSEGEHEILGIADNVLAVFDRWRSGTLNFMEAGSINQIFDPLEKKWYQVNVTMPFQYDFA